MQFISRLVCLGVLVTLSVYDIRTRAVPLKALLAAGAAAVLYQGIQRDTDLWLLAGGGMVGGCFILISKITRENFGYGDSIGILVLGIYLGLWKAVEVLAGTFFLLAAGAVLALSVKKLSRKTALPFFPFLTGGYVMVILTEGWFI